MVNVEIYEESRSQLMSLFALADDSPLQVAGYMELGVLLVAREENEVIGYLQVIETSEPAVFEIKSIAVSQSRQKTGIGRDLVRAALRLCLQRGACRLVVATATADTGNLRFYQRQGFRMFRIVRDAFMPSKGYAKGIVVDGILLRDQVWLELDLTDAGGRSPIAEAIGPTILNQGGE